jgi:hypothetical protein
MFYHWGCDSPLNILRPLSKKGEPGRSNALLLMFLIWLGGGASFSCQAGEMPAISFDRNAAKDWLYLDNGQIRWGVKKTSGCAIGYCSPSTSTKNLLNNYDRGRFVQQSYYGDLDGSVWDGKPWRWNPVQGGGCLGGGAKLLELNQGRDKLYAKSFGVHWASGAMLPQVIMEEWITLTGRVAHVNFKMTYEGTNAYRSASQEIPAFFADSSLQTLVLYDGQKPWTGDPTNCSRPGWPNERRRMTENWAAYVDDKDFGIGAYVPMARELTCYRFKGVGAAGCSYFAPLANFAIRPGFIFRYDVYLTVGKTSEIRDTFYRIHRDSGSNGTQASFGPNGTDTDGIFVAN